MLEISMSDNKISVCIEGKEISRLFYDDNLIAIYSEILHLLKTLHIEFKEIDPVELVSKAHPEGHAQKVG